MQELKHALDRMHEARPAVGDWPAVLRDARAVPRQRFGRLAVVLAAAAALFALGLVQPWESERPTVLERALAAVGEGPVLHAVLRGEWGGTLVELETGRREAVHGENEVWYDPERGLVHSIARLGSQVQSEQVYEPKEPPAELAALGGEYRRALESGSARVAGEDVLEGEPVYWITFHRELLPDVADGLLHEWARQVAVSRESFEPVAVRETRDGTPGAGTQQRVLSLETLPAGEGDFTSSRGEGPDGMAYSEARERIALEEAGKLLGRAPLWLGQEHAGLPLAEVSRTTFRTGRQRLTELHGREAEDALICRGLVRRSRAREGAACDRMRAAGRALQIRDGKVYMVGPVEWREEQVGVGFAYWARPGGPFVGLAETTRQPAHVRGVGAYVPPDGSVFVAAGGRSGFLHLDGVYVAIEASSEELVLSSARALRPVGS